MADARRNFLDLHASNKSLIAAQAPKSIQRLYDVERELKDASAEQRLQRSQEHSKPILDALHHWMIGQRQSVPEGSAIAKALDYSLKRWAALVRYLDDGDVPIDNNRVVTRYDCGYWVVQTGCSPYGYAVADEWQRLWA